MNVNRIALSFVLALSFFAILRAQERCELAVSYSCLYRTAVEDVKPFNGIRILNRSANTSVFLCPPDTVRIRGHLIDGSENPYRVYKNLPENGKLTYREMQCEKNYYTESIPDFNWQMLEGDSTVCGYQCGKAKTTFRGRTWVVWYTMDLPYADGPWKLCGLPGLILRAEDTKGDYSFTAFKVEKGQGEPIALDIKGFKEVNPAKWQKEIAESKKNPDIEGIKKVCVNIPDYLLPKSSTACFMEYFDDK